MSILPIHITGSPVLHSRAAAVSAITAATQRLIDDMIETMHHAPGVGLAAPQVGVGQQIFVWHYDDGETLSEGVILNPELTTFGKYDHRWWGTPDEEGCLSIPGERAPLARPEGAILTGLDRDGNALSVRATGWLARIFQHEFDHLHGILYRDRVRRHYRQIIDAAVGERGWGGPGNTWTPGPDSREEDFVADDLGHSED